ncbi:hypothetical protein [Planctopirus hydrillae]|uniref:hypothetical protein n=1 Tax=Planctopirus hydrillae TaxID=1841610 RepID=UPI001042756A|nr:hypothetical protein [Planctopirus hydrillae]
MTPKMEFTNEWVIPGIYVKKYSILYKPTGEQDRFGRLYTSVNTSGVVETFQEKNETCLPAIRLYWIKPLFRGEISVMVTIAGRSKSASAKPEVSAPIVNIVPQTTTDVPPVFVDENVLKFGKISKGITVSALCATGSDGAGEFRFLQRVTFDRTVTRRQEFATQIRDSTERTRTTEWVLDRKDEIQDAWHFQNRSLHLNNIDAGGITMTDSPEITTLRTAISASVADETFDLRLMYRPDGEDSIWVSLKTVTWGWSAMASGVPAFSLAIIGNPVIKPINVEDSVDLPIWSLRALDVPLERSTVTTSR